MAKTKKVKVVYESNAAKFNKDTQKVRDNVKGVGNDAKGTSKGMSTLTKGLNAVKGAALSAAGAFGTMASALMTSGIGAILVPLGALAGLFGTALKRSISFERGLSQLKAISGATADDMERLSNQAKALGSATKFTADEVVELQTEFARLGFNTMQIQDVTEATLNLASAAGVELAEAAEVAGSTLRGFGLSTSETQRVVDVMAKSFSESSLNMERFRESMKLVAPIAKTVKVDIEQSSAAIAVLANRGITGSLAGTQLRRVMSDLAQKTGVSFRDSLDLTADRLAKATGDAEKLAIAKELVGDRAKGSLIALAENREELDKLTTSFDNAEGAAATMAATIEDNLQGDITKLTSAIDGFFKKLEDGSGGMNTMARAATRLATGFVNFAGNALQAMMNLSSNVPVIINYNIKVVKLALKRMLDVVKLFAIDSAIAMADVPIIGKLIDKKKLKMERVVVENHLKMLEGSIKESANRVKRATLGSLLTPFRPEEIEDTAGDTTPTQGTTTDDDFIPTVDEEEDEDKSDPKLEARLKKRANFLQKLKEMQENFEDTTEQQKILRQRDRHLAELENIMATEEEKAKLKADINKLYADKVARYEEGVKKQQRADELRENKRLKDEIFGHAVQVFGQESKMAKAMHFAKMAMKIKEALLDAGIIKGKAAAGVAEAGQKVANAAAENSGNPLKLAATLIAGAAMVAQSIRAKSKIDSETNKFTSALGGSPSAGSSAPPSFNVIGATSAGDNLIADSINSKNEEPVKAYVVESEITAKQKVVNEARKLGTL